MPHKLTSIDGCTAAAYIAYAFSDVATIYPITPVASMGETADRWQLAGVKNLYGSTMDVREMESELGAAGATHGALAAGSLATTFTASQGLMLMIPNMYKIAGELLPGVFHVGCRSLATQALSIFGDHQDVMACRATGFTMLASASVQETHDLAIVAHLAALEGSLPVLHFFDGWRTSNETATIETVTYDQLRPLLPLDKVAAFRARGLNPEHPVLRGSAQNWDVYFQNREAVNRYYMAFPDIVQRQMDRVAALTGRQYHLFDYVGDPAATDIIISMGSSCDVVELAVETLNARGGHFGAVKVRLYRPFDSRRLLDAIPATVKRIAVLDRTKEPGAEGEPLYLDVAAAVQASGRDILVIGGRYGLSSKAFDPTMVKAVFDNLQSGKPQRGFTVGIDDDVTHLSLAPGEHLSVGHQGTTAAMFYGMGSDGTVGATRTASHIITAATDLYAQAYFQYSAKKSGGFTISQLRFGPKPIREAYDIEEADYVGCNKDVYAKRFPLLDNIVDGGTFVLNTKWSAARVEAELPGSVKRQIASRRVKFYTIDAQAIAAANGLGVRINMIMLAVFFRLRQIIPYAQAIALLKQYVAKLYTHEGGAVVEANKKAIDAAVAAIRPYDVPAAWADAKDEPEPFTADLPDFVRRVARPCDSLRGDSLPVSVFAPDGSLPMGTTAYEKRTIAEYVPEWNPDKCVECAECSLVCPHAAIRPFLLDEAEAAAAPAALTSKQGHGPLKDVKFRIQVFPRDCTGCGSCATICPGHALTMEPLDSQLQVQEPLLDYCMTKVTSKAGIIPRDIVNGSQFYQPLLQFSGACAGCGETPYVKLLTQLMGERLVIANATGCSSIWGADYPSNAYCTNAEGRGPAWANSLFEDNAEYGYGMAVAIAHRRAHLADLAEAAVADKAAPQALADALKAWLAVRGDAEASRTAGDAAIDALKANPEYPGAAAMLAMADMFAKKSVWAIGGDGWAYDIGFAGLDHVLAQNVDINILVMDTECYSNTGGQTSKATPLGAVAKYSAGGKRVYKKDLGRMMMTYPDVYVASIALGANYMQAIRAMVEADRYAGPSIVIAYCPCINHGIRAGMGHSIVEERNAVATGYWQLYRYNPAAQEPLTVDMAAPDGGLVDFINGEDRYADLRMTDPKEAAILQPKLQDRCDEIFRILEYQALFKG